MAEGGAPPGRTGLVLGCTGKKGQLTALVDSDDIHCLMIGASGVGKTAFFLYPNLEYTCASGMSFFASDTKRDLARNYGAIARDCYGYQVAVVDLRNPTRSDGYNLLTLINHYMDVCRKEPTNWPPGPRRRSTPRSLQRPSVNPEGDASNYGRMPTFMTRRRACLPLSSFCWRSTCRQRKRPAGTTAHRQRVQTGAGSAGSQQDKREK